MSQVGLQIKRRKNANFLLPARIKLWRFGENEAKKTYEGHDGVINCLKFSETLLVSGSADATSRIWDTQSATLLHTLKHEVEEFLNFR